MATLQDQLNSAKQQALNIQSQIPQASGYTNPNAAMQQVSAPAAQSTQPAALTPPVNTAQPSPSTVNANPYTGNSIVDALNSGGQASDFDSRTKLAQQYGIQNYSGTADQNTQLLQKYQTGFSQAKQSGTAVPQTNGQGSAMVNNFTGGATPTPQVSPVDTILAQDKDYQSLLQLESDYKNSESQRKSFVDEYKQFEQDAGLDQIQTDRMNMKRIIDGTEDDIRSEVQSAGGFATESQVQALAGARNKSLIKNYNSLVDLENNALQRINTLVGLSKQDRDYAYQQFQTQMGIAEQKMQFRDKALNNAKESYNAIIKQSGYEGLYQAVASDPSALALVEKTLGLQSGGLQQLASYKAPQTEEEKLDLELKKGQLASQKSDLQTDALQRQNIQSQINDRNQAPVINTLNGKDQSADQLKANGYGDRLNEADIIIANLGSKFTGNLSIGGSLPNLLQSGDRQAYEQAKKNFVTAVLRRESGASIAPTEFKTAEEQYFPQAGDKSDVLVNKEKARNTAVNNMYREANVLRPVLPGQIIESDGKKYRVASDGQTLQLL